MKVLWRSDLGQGKHDPLEITHVVTKSGSQISADLVIATERVNVAHSPEAEGLLEVIDAQMVAIDDLTRLVAAKPDPNAEHAALKEWAYQFPLLIEDLCMALGYARNPIGPTGIPELDILVGLSR